MTESTALASPTPGTRRPRLFWIGILALVVIVAICVAGVVWADTIPKRVSGQQTVVVGPDQLVPGGPAGLRVLVREVHSGRAVDSASLQVSLHAPGAQAQVLYTGRTDALGTANLMFRVPEDLPAEAELWVEASSAAGKDRVVKKVKAVRPARIFLTSDKPVYQPGQVMHLRALMLNALDLQPLRDAALQFVVEDAKGNKVFRRTVATSDYGIAAADFALAEEVNHGAYTIAAEFGENRAEKTVTVKWYVLPKFRVEISTDRAFYLPGEIIRGHIQAEYFFGKPVAGGQVQVTGAVYDVERRPVAEARATADANGGADFALEVPGYLVGTAKEIASYTLEATVTDGAGHVEQTSLDLTIAYQPILIEAVPESGQLRPGVDNLVYILTSYPDGSPAETTLVARVAGQSHELASGKHGVAELRLRPKGGPTGIEVEVRDATGRTGQKTIDLDASEGADQVLLRPDRPTYQVGETMHLEAFSAGRTRTVYLDIVKERQTLLMQAADIVEGKARFDIDVSADLVGALELNAYHVQGDGSLVRDTRIVVVNAPLDIEVAFEADKETYRPGEVAKLAFHLSRQGQPVQGALALSIVDESVFSVEEQDPGFARMVFLLEAELLKPRYQIKDTLQPILLVPPVQPGEPAPAPDQQQLASAQAALAVAPAFDFAWLANSFAEKMATALRQRTQSLGSTGTRLLWLLTGLPLLLVGVACVALNRRGVLRKALRSLAVSLAVLLLASCVLLPLIGYGLYQLYSHFELGAVALFVVAWVGCLAALAWDAVVRRDEPVEFVALLLVAWAILFGLLMYATQQTGAADVWQLLFMALLSLTGVVGVYLLGLGLRLLGARLGSAAAIGLAALTVPVVTLVAMIPALSASPVSRALSEPAVYAGPLGLLTGCAPRSAPQPTPAPPVVQQEQGKGVAVAALLETPRLRQYFPETLYWNPETISDEQGRVSLDVPLADSITTWRLSAQASTARGELGGLTAGLRVFQDFFVDLDLPVALTQDDEIAVPVSVFNYLEQAQTVRLEIQHEGWFDLLDDTSKTLTVAPNDVTAVYFRIRARDFGRQKLTVTAWGERMSDAIAREVRILPDGKEIHRTASDWLRDGTKGTVRIPADAIDGTAKVLVKVYPGLVSQVVEGLDGLLRLPFG